MYMVGQAVSIIRTGSYGTITGLVGESVLVVTIEDGPTLRFDRSQVELVNRDPREVWDRELNEWRER